MYFKPEPDINKEGKITDILSSTREILVQVAKEPISSKGPRLSSEMTLAGRYLSLFLFLTKFLSHKKFVKALSVIVCVIL
jgi:ribonuclease G